MPPDPKEPQEQLTIVELISWFWKHVETYYQRQDGTPSKEVTNFKLALRPVRRLYGRTPAADFGSRSLKAVRKPMIHNGGTRRYVNKHIGRIKLMFKWVASEELIPPSVYRALQTGSGLKGGRTEARETKPVMPVPDEHVDAIKMHVRRVSGRVRGVPGTAEAAARFRPIALRTVYRCSVHSRALSTKNHLEKACEGTRIRPIFAFFFLCQIPRYASVF